MDPKEDKLPLFSAYVLFSEGVQFEAAEIFDALTEDYPDLDVRRTTGTFIRDTLCDTNQFITEGIIGLDGEDAAGPVQLVRLPGYGQWDFKALRPMARVNCPDLEERLARNRSYLAISVPATGRGLVEKFTAARLCSALAAVFAKLPVALAVYWEPADHFLSPEKTIQMADEALRDEWPILQWVGFDAGFTQDGSVKGLSIGMRAFADCEVSYAPAPVDIPTSVTAMHAFIWLKLVSGNPFNDGDTIGSEADAVSGKANRLRLIPKGKEGASCDTWLILHPEHKAEDLHKFVEPKAANPPPSGVDNNVQPRAGFFQSILRGRRQRH
ncbi:hypothetical protein POI8812_02251 [Pontivivens insulae]|uniref:DUF4261 domain-containing protein n=2 Tax=Pontivivens insulae TaxID=1639689 RepID=A0A2R8ACX3_9RHOB|nr:hypothetical protein DFR53_1197 [Pontivivens insulae]SPF29925.1 hypothetical protein POI8812_02251 [Pontivivens insulae]